MTTPKESYLFILPWSLKYVGGVNQVVENLFSQMKLDGKYTPIIMVNSWDDVKIRKEKINEIDHYFFRLRSPWNASKKMVNFTAFCMELLKTSWRFYKFINLHKITTINVHYCSLFALNISFIKFIRLFKGHLILSFHGKDLLFAKQSQDIEKLLWKILLRSAERIITCSESLKNELALFDKFSFHKIVSVHNGIDISFLAEVENRQIGSLLEKKRFILNVATLEYKKGQDILLKAFKKIENEFEDINLIIIGRSGGVEYQIQQLIESLNLSQKVIIYDGLAHKKVLEFMKQTLFFVLPSRYEPFGIVILEAGVFGKPVIASNLGGIPEILSHNVTGILFESEDINALAKEMRNLLNQAEERNRLGKNLREHVLKKFSWKRTYLKYLNAIRL